MSKARRRQAYPMAEPDQADFESEVIDEGEEQTLELREEELIAHKDLRELGEIQVRTEVDQLPGRIEVDAYREEVVIEHETVGKVVSEREQPSQDGDVLIVPIYEEQIVVTKRLVLRERMHIRRIGTRSGSSIRTRCIGSDWWLRIPTTRAWFASGTPLTTSRTLTSFRPTGTPSARTAVRIRVCCSSWCARCSNDAA